MYNLKDHLLYIKPDYGQEIAVGEIIDDYFKNTDKDNYHRESQSLGIDKEVLYAKDLKYKYITMKFHGRTLITTRKFFYDHSTERKLLNGRNMLFMEIKDFSLSKALRYERKLEETIYGQMDIFDVFNQQTKHQDNNNATLRKWEEAINKERIII
jgi:hypothetical protein